MLTPRDSSTVGELGRAFQQPTHSSDRLSAEIESERKSEAMARTKRNLILVTQLLRSAQTLSGDATFSEIPKHQPREILFDGHGRRITLAGKNVLEDPSLRSGGIYAAFKQHRGIF